MTGQGIDRHLFALYIISKGLKIESEFLDDYIKREWTLSTTQVSCSLNNPCESLSLDTLPHDNYGRRQWIRRRTHLF